jgi:hypothetical protein
MPVLVGRPKPRGAHFSPFAFKPLGPIVPTYAFLENRGLVLDNVSQHWQLGQLDNTIAKYQVCGTLSGLASNLSLSFTKSVTCR